ncbi:MAG: hypothetical protein M0R51_13865 [Clostridia bacterium]|jgi:hypothetical protein|nr:hypothetical protein [Clostridia bacterium]
MTEKIKIGLHLSGKDADDFNEYMANPISTKDADEAMQNALSIEKSEYERKLTEIKQILQHNLKCSENEASEYITDMKGNPKYIQEVITKLITAIENDRIEYAKSLMKEPITIKYICKFILTFIIMQSAIFILTPIWIIFMIYMFRLENLLVMKFIFLLINGVM